MIVSDEGRFIMKLEGFRIEYPTNEEMEEMYRDWKSKHSEGSKMSLTKTERILYEQ